jgi:hypothetical protein
MNRRLNDIAEVKIGYSLRERVIPDVVGNVYFLTPKDISSMGEFCFCDATKMTITNPSKHFVRRREILLTSRGRFFAVVFNSPINNNFVVSSGFHRIKITDAKFLPEYVALFLNSKEGQKALESRQETMTVPIITIMQLKNIQIPLASLEKQRQLIELTGYFSNWRALRRKQEGLQSTIINQTINKIIGGQNG